MTNCQECGHQEHEPGKCIGNIAMTDRDGKPVVFDDSCECGVIPGYTELELRALPHAGLIADDWDGRAGRTLLSLLFRELCRRVGEIERRLNP